MRRTATGADGIVRYTAHEPRHVCASLLIASDRAEILDAMNQAVSRMYAYEKLGDEANEIGA